MAELSLSMDASTNPIQISIDLCYCVNFSTKYEVLSFISLSFHSLTAFYNTKQADATVVVVVDD